MTWFSVEIIVWNWLSEQVGLLGYNHLVRSMPVKYFSRMYFLKYFIHYKIEKIELSDYRNCSFRIFESDWSSVIFDLIKTQMITCYKLLYNKPSPDHKTSGRQWARPCQCGGYSSWSSLPSPRTGGPPGTAGRTSCCSWCSSARRSSSSLASFPGHLPSEAWSIIFQK